MIKVKQPHGGVIVNAEKGETANPNGRPKKTIRIVNDELRAAGYEPSKPIDISDCYLTLINLPIEELKAKVEENNQPALVRIVGKAILSGKGFDVLEKMLDRSIGKAVQQIDLSGAVNTKQIIAKAFPEPTEQTDEVQPESDTPD
jgi:hypothetical protein